MLSASAAPCAKVESTRVSSPRLRRTHPAFRTQWLERRRAWRPRRTLRVSAVCRALAYRQHDLCPLRGQRSRGPAQAPIWLGDDPTGTTHASRRPPPARSSPGVLFDTPDSNASAAIASRLASVTIANAPRVRRDMPNIREVSRAGICIPADLMLMNENGFRVCAKRRIPE